MGSCDITYCVNRECPVKGDCRRGAPNHPMTEAPGIEPRLPQLSLGWFGDPVGNLGETQVAENWWCDEFWKMRD